MFSTPRSHEFFTENSLISATGRSPEEFGDVVIKELLDNALDAAEDAGVQPAIAAGVATTGGTQVVTVADNGPGIPPDVVPRILDFNDTVSSKAKYRSPTRGLQGNAWKTLLGIRGYFKTDAAIVIEACGVRHEIAAGIDEDGNVTTVHEQGESDVTTGTLVQMPLPGWLTCDVLGWLQKAAALNPHATLTLLANSGDAEDTVFCNTVDGAWKKPTPKMPTYPHWYTPDALYDLVRAYNRAQSAGGRDLPIGEFIRNFGGMSARDKERAVKEQLSGVTRVSDLRGNPDAVTTLLKAMQAEGRQPKPTILGSIPKEHFRARLDALYGVVPDRFWHKRDAFEVDGIPWLVEVAVAETERPGSVIYGVNYSPTFGDPTARTLLDGHDGYTSGATGVLSQAGAMPQRWEAANQNRAAIVHLSCPTPQFADKGKVALEIPKEVAEKFAGILTSATKALYVSKKRAEKDARAERNRQEQHRKAESRREAGKRVTLKEAVEQVMAEAIAEASDGGRLPFPTRNLFYAVRPRIQSITDAELKMNYFSQALVVEYEREHGKIPGHYRDPRGELTEPHTGVKVRLGTREVADYVLPKNLFNKILYVEKEGFAPIFESSGIADRYDMAIASGKGQPVEAVRDLFARADAGPGNYKLFVLHDADHAGYVIAKAIAEETARMPGYRVQVIDLGLSVEEAVKRDLPLEKYTRQVELPFWMPERLTPLETDWFGGRKIGRKQWECTRVELNALGAAGLIDLIERGLEQHNATLKVIPERREIVWNALGDIEGMVGVIVNEVLAEIIDPDAIKSELTGRFGKLRYYRPISQSLIRRRLRRNPRMRWTGVVHTEVGRRIEGDKVRRMARELIEEQIRKHADDTDEAT